MRDGLYGEVLETIERYVELQPPWDGKYWGIGENGELVKVDPPVHVNCRCMMIKGDRR